MVFDCECDFHVRQIEPELVQGTPSLPTAAPGPVVQARRNARKRLNDHAAALLYFNFNMSQRMQVHNMTIFVPTHINTVAAANDTL